MNDAEHRWAAGLACVKKLTVSSFACPDRELVWREPADAWSAVAVGEMHVVSLLLLLTPYYVVESTTGND